MFDGIKAHVGRHKVAYSVGTIVVIAGITCVIMKERCVVLHKGANGPSLATTRSFSFNLFSNKSGNVVTTIHDGSRGHPGFRVRNLDHMIDFDTQGAAARAFDIPENVMSLHLNKRIPDAYGKVFERIPA